jgi:hypothetical protein
MQALARAIGHFLDHAAHAAADVEQKDKVERLLLGGELQDGLFLALVEDAKVLSVEAS